MLDFAMALDATVRRRWLGALSLLAALALLICGETVLKGRLRDVAFILYWLVCFVLTGIAIVVAFLDVRTLQHRVRQEHRDLLETTLKKIETDARSKPRPAARNGGPHQ
jgi:hypothetical protein